MQRKQTNTSQRIIVNLAGFHEVDESDVGKSHAELLSSDAVAE